MRPSDNLGFAVPVNTVKTVVPQLKDKGKVVRGFLPVSRSRMSTRRSRSHSSYRLATAPLVEA